MNKSAPPAKLGILGTAIAISIGAMIFHTFSHGPTPQAMKSALQSAPTFASTGTGMVVGGLTAVALPNLPFVGPPIMAWITFFTNLIGLGSKIKGAIPPELYTDIKNIILGNKGVITLDDLQKLLLDFEQVNPSVIFQLIREIMEMFRASQAASSTSDNPATEAAKAVSPDAVVVKV